jgi:exodeoxyribonuclease V alpha subunit
MMMSAQQQPLTETLTGTVERITYHNEENGFCVLRLKSRGHRELVTLVGHLAVVTTGEFLEATGGWAVNAKFGQQFKAEQIKAVAPTTKEGIEKYLASGLIKGIGPHFAKVLVEKFGDKVFETLDTFPEQIKKIKGFGGQRYETIMQSWQSQKHIREIMLFLHQYNVTTSRAVKIYKTYGSDSIKKIKENPYCLARDIRGIGFLTADQIAQNMGVKKDSMLRARAGLHYALLENLSDGNTAIPKVELAQKAQKLLEIDEDILEKALVEELAAGDIVEDDIRLVPSVFIKNIYRAEQSIAEQMTLLAKGKIPWDKRNWDMEIAQAERANVIELAEHQQLALKLALSSKVSIITGGPGVGKTTIINTFLSILRPQQLKICLAAPTGRAAKRMSESTGHKAKTIHRLLEIDPSSGRFRYDRSNPLPCDLLIIDEASMVDTFLMQGILRSLSLHTALIMVGDVDQLPSVGPGQVLHDLIESNRLPVARLTHIFRQAAGSHIIMNAHRINENKMPHIPDPGEESDFYFVPCDEPEEGLSKLIKMLTKRIPSKFNLDPARDVQILCPMNRGGLGAHALNLEIKKHLIPDTAINIQKFGVTYSVGDKVMQIENNYDKEIFNGDMGFVEEIDTKNQAVTVNFEDKMLDYSFEELDQLMLAYAISIHKSQGSEFPAVIIPIMTQHYPMLRKNLIYTAVTRGKKLVVLLGQKKALAIALKGQNQEYRWTKLKEWLEN